MENERLSQLLELLKLSPDDSFLLFAVGKEYEGQENYNLALKYYLKLKDSDPEYIGLYYHLAHLYILLQEDILALGIFEKGITLAKKLGDFHALSELNNAKTNLEITLGN